MVAGQGHFGVSIFFFLIAASLYTIALWIGGSSTPPLKGPLERKLGVRFPSKYKRSFRTKRIPIETTSRLPSLWKAGIDSLEAHLPKTTGRTRKCPKGRVHLQMEHKMFLECWGARRLDPYLMKLTLSFCTFPLSYLFATFAMKKLIFLSSSGIYCLSFILGPKRKIILERFAGVRILQLFSGL